VLDLEKLVERQFAYAARQTGERLLLALPRAVGFVSDEPRLRAIVADIVHEYDAAVETFRAVDRQVASEILKLWQVDAEWIVAAWNIKVSTAGDAAHLAEVAGNPDHLPLLLEAAGDFALSPSREPAEPGVVADALFAIRHWTECIQHDLGTPELEQKLQALNEQMFDFQETHESALRRFLAVVRSHPAASWLRLNEFARSLTAPLTYNASIESGAFDRRRVGNAALGLGRHDHEKATPGDYAEQVLSDLDIVSEELRHRIGLHLSNWALVNRFKTRCQRFDANELREAALKDPGKAEEVLTRAAAAYLFDCGLNPLINTQIAALRPDLFDPTTPFSLYIEAKQYDSSPRQKIIAAAWQVWDTWNEIEEAYQVREAFLLIFRRAGPLVVFEGTPPHLNGRALYPVLVDIADVAEKGSRTRSEPIRIEMSELLPRAASKPSSAR
jgi:hypothetical protein